MSIKKQSQIKKSTFNPVKASQFPMSNEARIEMLKAYPENKQLLPKINTNQQINKKNDLQQNNDLQKCLKIINIESEKVKLVRSKINSLIEKLNRLNGTLYSEDQTHIFIDEDKDYEISFIYQNQEVKNDENFFKYKYGTTPQEWNNISVKMYNALQKGLMDYNKTLQELITNIKRLKPTQDYKLYTDLPKIYMTKYRSIEKQIRKKQKEVEQQYQEAKNDFQQIGQKANKMQSSINNSIKDYNYNCYQVKKNNDLNNQNHKLFGYLKNNNKQNNLNLPFLNNHGNNLNQQLQMNKENNHNANPGNNNNYLYQINNNQINNINFLPKAHNKKLTNNKDPLKDPHAILQYYSNLKNKHNLKMINSNPDLKFNNNNHIKQNENKIHIQKLNIIPTNNNQFNNNINNNNNQNKDNNYNIISPESKPEQKNENNINNINNNIKLPNININSKQNPANNQIKLPPINKKIKLKEIKLTKQQKILKCQDNILAIVNNQLNKMDKNHLSDSTKQLIEQAKKTVDNTKQQVKAIKKKTNKELAEIKKEQYNFHQFFAQKANNNNPSTKKELNELWKEIKQEKNGQNQKSSQNIISKKDINDDKKALEELNNFLK